MSLTSLDQLSLTIAVVQFKDAASLQAAQALLRIKIPHLIVDQHAIAYPMQQSAGTQGKQYALELLNVQSSAQARLVSPVIIGVVDTEVANPSALQTSSFKARRIFSESDKPALPDHGSGVAAIIAGQDEGQFHGAAQGAHLRVASVMKELAPGINATNTALVAQALDWLASEKAQVINLSLGSAHDAVLAAVITKMQRLGIVMVAAAGNGGSTATPSYPAAYPGMVAVTAVDAGKQLYARANRGEYISLAAPGVDIWVPIGLDKGKYMSGTSFATPFVTAAIAHRLSHSPPLQRPNSNTLLKALCDKALPLSPVKVSTEFGCGLLQF